MLGFNKRAVAIPAAALGALGLVGISAGAAHAAVTSGTVTLNVSSAFMNKIENHSIELDASGAASVVEHPDGSLTITFNATGGDATLVDFAGTISYSGALDLENGQNNREVSLTGLLFDLTDTQFDGQTGTSGETPLLDLAGSQFGNISNGEQTYSSTDLQIDSAGAALLDSALHTTLFAAGDSVGSFTATWQ